MLNKLDILAPLRLQPRVIPRDYSGEHASKGADYHGRFAELPGRKIMWDMEQELLLSLAKSRGPFGSHLDFAGGTGRIAGCLTEHCGAQYILDVSASMLAVAEENVATATILCRDFRTEDVPLPTGGVDLVTAFRFFPNAEANLREVAMAFIARSLRDGGLLICNNHRNFWSIPYIAQRALLYRGGAIGMTTRQMAELGARHGLTLDARYSLGIVPLGERFAVAPWRLVRRIEYRTFRQLGMRHTIGYNIVHVFRKSAGHACYT